MTLFVGQVNDLNRQRASQAAGLAAAAIGAAAFSGWWVPLPLLLSGGLGFAAVKPTTALCLTALGLVLAHPGRTSRLAVAVGLAVAVVSVLDQLDRFGISSGINRLNCLLVPHAAVPGSAILFRAINGVPVALALTAVSLALSRFERYYFVGTAFSGLAGLLQVFALIAYLSGVLKLFGSIETATPPTAVGLLCVVIAIVLRIGAIPALRKPRPLWHLLIMFGCATIAPLLLVGVYTAIRITDAQFNAVRDELTSEARRLSATVDREIGGEIERLQALAASASLRQGDLADFQRQAEASLAWRQSGNIVLVDGDMRELVNTAVSFGTPLKKAAISRSLVERSLATGKPQVTDLFIGSVTKRLMFSVIVPVQIDGENRYALARSPSLHTFASLVAASELPAGWQAAVSDATHRVIAASDPQYAFPGKELPRAQWLRAAPGAISEFVDSQGRPAVEAYARSELTGWGTMVWAPKALLYAAIRALWWAIGLTVLVAVALVLSLASWLGRLIARSVGYAARAATTLGKGGSLPSDETPVAEVDTLMTELHGAAARRQAAEQDLQVSKDRLQLALDAARLGWWQYDPRLSKGWGDARANEIFGFGDAKKEVAVEDLLQRVHPDDVERVRRAIAEALDPADPRTLAIEYRVLRGDGTLRWVENHGLAYFEAAGPELRGIGLVGTLADITERKEREEKEHLLIREINHRAKNMLSVVDSIARQTATRSPEHFIERFSERIQALSANQDLLVRNEWRGVYIVDLVRTQFAHFADLIGSRIAMEGPRLRLNPASAQAIGLALHELATNASKYGALSTDKGYIDICWEIDDDALTMSWTERGGPPVTAPKQHGFGTIVLKAMAARSVNGMVQLKYASSGVIWRLTCPAANVLESGGR